MSRFQARLDNALIDFKVLFFEEDSVTSVPTIKGMIDLAGKIRTKRTWHRESPGLKATFSSRS